MDEASVSTFVVVCTNGKGERTLIITTDNLEKSITKLGSDIKVVDVRRV